MTDSVGTDSDAITTDKRPWSEPGWLLSRLKEMVYALFSWPYVMGFVMTVFFIRRPDAITLQAMIAAWLLAFARREFANWMAGRKPPGT